MSSVLSTAGTAPTDAANDSEWYSPELPGSAAPKTAELKYRPLQVTWEMTRTGNLKYASLRAGRSSARNRQLYSTAEAFHLIDQIAGMHVPLMALTGGDPLLRPDLIPILEFASRRSVRTSLMLLPSPRLNEEVIAALKASGVMRVVFWIHASTPSIDDRHWAISGAHRRTLELIGSCHEVQLPVQINTMLTRRNLHDVDPMIELLTRLDVALWNVFFSVPATPEEVGEILDATEHEQVFAKLYAASKNMQFQIKTTEGQHYQRYVAEQRVRESRGHLKPDDIMAQAPRGINDGKGSVFIGYDGEVYPSRFLPLSAGNVMSEALSDVYGASPLFQSLRDSSQLKGKCGRCPAKNYCGGSRARAYAMTGDLFAAEPCCAYQP
jgi:radical SAM protein with 4Fe4S-binding SPASM domain